MRDELQPIHAAISKHELPPQFQELFASLWDGLAERFHVQETYILDYKETIPESFTDSYGAGIVRLALAFHNSFGGLVVFGVKDRTLNIEGVTSPFDIESFNRVLTDVSGVRAECLSKLYAVEANGQSKNIACVLVPRRPVSMPARLIKPIGKYPTGKLWVRDRHEVVEAGAKHLPIIFSDRERLPSDIESDNAFPVHRSLPPSPATVKEFINRGDLLTSLWAWFVLGDQPRLYLHGPGGSGKSTLAFEFARLLAEHGHSVKGKNGDKLDYVVYISAKETEFNAAAGKEQKFALRQFGTASEQYVQILHHSGLLNKADLDTASPDEVEVLLGELFGNFSGLIVLDDIDALSRRAIDTGEENVFMKAVLARKRTRIIYTLRFPPQHALNSALAVPGLDPNTEFYEFLEVCCRQFGVPKPTSEKIPHIEEASSRLPLLIETIVGLRRYCGTYAEAVQLFADKGGLEARRYLYQREYDRLDSQGKSRQVLAGLLLLEEPVSFTVFSGLFQHSAEQVRDALSECASVFLSTFEGEAGETLYQLTPPCVPFIRHVSEELPYFSALKIRVDHFKSEGRASPEEAAIIVTMQNLIRDDKREELVAIAEKMPRQDPVLLNPKVRALLGRAYSEMEPTFREKARECFRHAEGLGYRDVFMMRSWFNMELMSGYALAEPERICRVMIEDPKVELRAKSEFWSKRGQCYLKRAEASLGVSVEKARDHFKQSIICYMEGLYIGGKIRGFDTSINLTWIERPLYRFISIMGSDLDAFFDLLEGLVDRKHDLNREGAALMLKYLTYLPVAADEGTRRQARSLCSKSHAMIGKKCKPLSSYPGFEMISDALASAVDELDRRANPQK